MDTAEGQRIGRYVLGPLIGTGGMGEVYRSIDSTLERTVAVKILPSRVSGDEKRLRQLLKEARTASSLSHPNVAHIYEAGQEDGRAYIAMELVEGTTLSARLAHGPITPRETIEIVTQVADALDAAHAIGIVHRDIKPGNIMLTPRGAAKILDFGLAKFRQPAEDDVSRSQVDTIAETREGFVVGTLHYMSPEQITGEPVDHRSDLFSLGVMLYEMVTGRTPFAGGTMVDVLYRISRAEPESPGKLSGNIPVELDRIIRKLLEKEPRRRYQSAADLVADLRNLQRDSDSHRSVKSVRKHRRARVAALGALALFILVVAAIVITRKFVTTTPRIDSIAVLPIRGETSVEGEALRDGVTESLIDSLSRIDGLTVMSRTSVVRFRNLEIDPRTVGKELDVEAIVTGDLRREGNMLILDSELVDARSRRRLWGTRLTRNASDILALQQDLAEDLSERLRDELTAADRKRLARQRTANPEAYRHYVEGRYEWNRRTGPSFRSAIYAFQRAIELDSRYALAWAGLADTYILQATYNEVPPIVALPMARAAAERALALDPDLAEAHTSLAYYLLNYDSDVNGAEREFRRAISLNPSYATAHHWYSLCLIAKKEQQQAIASIGRAVRLDPLSPIIRAEAGAILVDAGRLAEARTECMEALRIDPKFAFALHILAAIELREHHPEKAIALSKQAWELGQDPRPLARMGQIHAQAGRTVEARQVLDLLIARSRERFVSPLLIARLAVAVGDRATALEWLERATRELAPGPLQRQLREDPQLEPLRGDPRFLRLLRD